MGKLNRPKMDPTNSTPPLCKCGCLKHVKWNKKKKRWNQFIGHHNAKGKNHPMYGRDRSGPLNPMFGKCGKLHWAYGKKGPLCHNFGKRRTEEYKKQKSIEMSGERNPNFGKTGELAAFYGKKHAEETLKEMSECKLGILNPFFNKHHSLQTLKQQSISRNKFWGNLSDKEKTQFMTIVGKANSREHPNKSENKLLKLLEQMYPGQWRYTGDYSFWINGKNPDFTHLFQKKLIELFGDYWHKGEDPKDRKAIFARCGYETLVIWESELKNFTKVKFRINKFMKQ